MLKGRAVKGVALTVWIGLLILVAFLASAGDISRNTNEFVADLLLRMHCRALVNPSPNQLLAAYLSHYQNPPPIESLLDRLEGNPLYSMNSRLPAQDERGMDRDVYLSLFSKLTFQLRSLSTSVSDSKDPQIEVVIPAVIGGTGRPEKVLLTPEILTWLAGEKGRLEKQRQRDDLIDTFFLLIVLGSFGSIIFLTRDFITGKNDTLFSAYVFRPVLGAFLAVAIFIIDIVTHTVVSTADILKVRHETLFLLALAAGLLSEHAYDMINVRAKLALEKWGQKLSKKT